MKKYLLLILALIPIGTTTYFFLPPKEIKVALQPLGEVPADLPILLKKEIEAFYFSKVEILPAIDFPDSTYYPPRKRYRADKTIAFLRSVKPDRFDKILGVTEKDISTTKGEFKDYGIMGLAYRPGRSGIVSTFRCKRNVSKKIATERMIKNTLHELGHNFGLYHCNFSPTCLMNDAKGTVKSVDKEKKELCVKCQMQIKRKLR